MAYFDCIVGGSGKGNTLVVTCADDLAGATITCTNGTKTYTKTCPSTAPYEVTFYGLMAGTWTVSATVSGNTYTTTVVVADIEALLGGFNWRTWVDTAQYLDSSDYNSLDEVLADELAVRELCLEHACVDYLADIATANEDVETIINNDLFAKWVNNSDYSLDILGANVVIKALMDEADKYGYGEWVITDNTTTPPTWGAKGNVPVMTSNTAPYGEASAESINGSSTPAYGCFIDENGVHMWASAVNHPTNTWVAYKATNPFICRKVRIVNRWDSYNDQNVNNFKIQASNDGTNWVDLFSGTAAKSTTCERQEFSFDNNTPYLYHRLYVLSNHGSSACSSVCHLQFYGRELKVSVPKMTGNNAPYCEASVNGTIQNSYPPYYLFDKVVAADRNYITIQNAVAGTNYYQIKMDKPIIPRLMRMFGNFDGSYLLTGRVDASKDGATYTTIKPSFEFNHTGNGAITTILIDTDEEYQYFRLYPLTWDRYCSFSEWEIFGEDYSEKEFEEGTTKKWLYDHGVELETLDRYKGSTTPQTDLPKTITDELFLTATGTNGYGNFSMIGITIDLTPYSLMRAIIGSQLKETATINDGAMDMGILNTDNIPSGGTYNDNGWTAKTDPIPPVSSPSTALTLDVSSIAQPKFIELSVLFYSRIGTATEWWLE